MWFWALKEHVRTLCTIPSSDLLAFHLPHGVQLGNVRGPLHAGGCGAPTVLRSDQ